MPVINRPNFCGASVLRTNASLGWGGQPSTFDVTLVEDPFNSDAFTYPSIGTPVSFNFGSLTFRGLIHKYVKSYDKNGFPTFEMQLIDPRQLLDGAKVIIAEYRLAVTGILNLFNIFGYWENTGYGNSQVNDTGMPWQLIGTGIANICNSAPGFWGGPISYRGVQYGIDMTQLPSLPSYFRIGGQSLSILDFIQVVCDAANYDYFITLSALNVITVNTVARSNEYPLGTIGTMLNSTFAGSVLRSSDGLEERAETTTTFVTGGPIHTLYQVGPSGTYPFWGFDASGVIMKGDVGDRHARFLAPSGTSGSQEIYSYPVKKYNLYVPDIGGITGNTTYTTNDLELQVLLGLGQNKDSFGTWVQYLRISDPSGYTRINLNSQGYGPSPQPSPALPTTPANIVNSSANRVSNITLANRGAIAQTGMMRLRTVYETLNKYAKDYYGKKFAINVPGIGRKIDTDTGVISYSHDVADGGWVDSTDVTNDLMGLPSYAHDLFQTQDGRFVGYARTDAYNADTSRINPTNTLIHSPASGVTYLYSKAKLNNQVYFDSASGSYVVAEIDPVYDYPDAVVGMSGVVGALIRATGIYFNTTAGATTDIGFSTLKRIQNSQQQGSLTYVTHPAARPPSGFEIPLKWNTLLYGPWYAQGASGNVVYEQDNSLVPWNYGGFINLNLAGNAKASMGISPINVIESGFVDVVGAPAYNIGDVIQANGPNITSIAVSVGKEGVTTTYRFETYVPQFGTLAKYNVDNMKRLSVANTRATAEMKARTRLRALNATAEAEASRTESLIPMMFEGVNIRSPHNMLVSTIISSGTQNYAVVSSSTYKESLGFVPDTVVDYNNLAIAPLDSVFSPYAINQTDTQMPIQLVPQSGWTGIPLNSDNLNPYKSSASGWTTRVYTKGTDVYEEINDDFREGENLTATPKRVFGVKGPQVMAGWGYDLHGNAVPGTGSPNYLTDCRDWKVGPIDPLWDDYRKVWTSHDILKGVTEQSIAAGSFGTVGLYQNNTDTEVDFVVHNWATTAIPSGTKINFGYNAHDNKLYSIGSTPDITYHHALTLTVITGRAGSTLGVGTVVYYTTETVSGNQVLLSTGIPAKVYNDCPTAIAAGHLVDLHREPFAGIELARDRCAAQSSDDCGPCTSIYAGPLCLNIGSEQVQMTNAPGTCSWLVPLVVETSFCMADDPVYQWWMTFIYIPSEGLWRLTVYISNWTTGDLPIEPGSGYGEAAHYTVLEDNWDCNSEVTLNLESSLGLCPWPATVTLTPGACVDVYPYCDVTVSFADADLSTEASTVTITGTGFSTTAANNFVTFNLGAAGMVTSSTATSLTVAFSTQPTVGALTAIVTVGDCDSGTAVQVATVVVGMRKGQTDCTDTPLSMVFDQVEGGNYTSSETGWFYFYPTTTETVHLTVTGDAAITVQHKTNLCSDQTAIDSQNYSAGGCLQFDVTQFETYTVLISGATGDVTVTLSTGVC